MPLYDIEHVTPLTIEQKTALAQAFTLCHAARFVTPKYFINVRFTDASDQTVFRGGVLRKYNRAILRTRASNDRSPELYNEHCKELEKIWAHVVGSEGETGLRTIWVLGALTTALEDGLARPQAGQEIQWLRENKAEFQRRAAEGDPDMQGLVYELATRPDFAGV